MNAGPGTAVPGGRMLSREPGQDAGLAPRLPGTAAPRLRSPPPGLPAALLAWCRRNMTTCPPGWPEARTKATRSPCRPGALSPRRPDAPCFRSRRIPAACPIAGPVTPTPVGLTPRRPGDASPGRPAVPGARNPRHMATCPPAGPETATSGDFPPEGPETPTPGDLRPEGRNLRHLLPPAGPETPAPVEPPPFATRATAPWRPDTLCFRNRRTQTADRPAAPERPTHG
jgi:hypothetical protein